MKKKFASHNLEKVGRVRGRVLENTNEDGTKRYSVDIFRTYRKRATGNSATNASFQDTFNFSKEDLHCVAAMAKQAHAKISELEGK